MYGAIHQLDACLDERLSQCLLRKVEEGRIDPGGQETILRFLLAHDSQPAMDYCLSVISASPLQPGEDRDRARLAADMLMRYATAAAWPALWRFVTGDEESGRWLFNQITDRPSDRWRRLFSLLDGRTLADVYAWLEDKFPPRPSSASQQAGAIARDFDGIEFLRNGVINMLRDSGEVEALTRLRERLPEQGWLDRVIAEAEEIHLRDTWEPPSPNDVLQLCQDRARRYVENGRQLLEVVVESLDRYQQALHGEGPHVRNLWDNTGTPKHPVWRPRSEDHLSDNIGAHLQTDLSERMVVVNREVRIRPGEETDIHITAFKAGPGGQVIEPITVIIEAKGCWHRDLETAIETQLVDRYLLQHHSPYGVYLVGWYRCERWTGENPNIRQCPTYDIAEARTRLTRKAEELSARGDAIVQAYVLDARLR
ncbi:hypothetical protein LCGC14_1273920 [marine sediment metagenome]|uniref:Uncharacterized protein n=1 Tax=marine sediment metagenome TaxID=412755 RepID=A0A0F9NDZ0_9ZZZZ